MAAIAARTQIPPSHGKRDVAAASAALAPAAQPSPPQSLGSNSASPASSGPASPQVTNVAAPSRRSLDYQQRPAQIGRPKVSAGFVPAALRPTQRPPTTRGSGHLHSQSRSTPPSPPRSLNDSTDSLPNPVTSSRGSPPSSSSVSTLTKTTSQGSVPKPHPIDTSNTRPTSSRTPSLIHSPTASLSSLSLTSLAVPGSLAPHPTRAHWKPDAMAASCDAPACPTVFSTFVRRHHCRRCGGIFCYRHANRQVPLDVEARMVPAPSITPTDTGSVPGTPRVSTAATAAAAISPDTTVQWTPDGATTPESNNGEDGRSDVGLWRACDGCHAEWVNWIEGLREAAENANADDAPGSRKQLPIKLGMPGGDRKSSIFGTIAGSIPRDWSWSTF